MNAVRQALLAALLLAACGSPPKPNPPPPDTTEVDCVDAPVATSTNGDCAVKLGTGHDAFEPLAGDDDVGFYMGLQGGHHVYASFLANGYALSGKTFVDARVLALDGTQLAQARYCAPLSTDMEVAGWREEVGHRVIFLDEVDVSKLVGETVVLEVTVDDLADPSLCAPTQPSCRARACARIKLHDAGPAPM